MSFGKLTITAESGEIDEHELTRPTTSVGRQPGNDIVLPTSAVSRYHAQFDAAEGQVFLVDLGTVNGSFVNDRQIEANGRIALKDGDVIQLGDVRMIFVSPRAAHGTGPLALHPTEYVDARVPIKIILDDPRQPVAPGSFLQFAMVIENHTAQERLFTVETEGMENGWVRINRREVRLADEEQTEVLISVRPPRDSDTRPGRYPLRVRVAYKDDPTQVVEVLREVDVMVYSGMAMAMKPGRQPGQYHLAVQNQGNHPLELEMSGYQAQNLLRFRFTPSRFTLDAGSTQQVVARLTAAKTPPQGRPIAFAVVAHSLDVAAYQAPLLGYFSPKKPSRSGWLAGLVGLPILALIGFLAVLVIAAGLMLAGIVPLPAEIRFGEQEALPALAITATPVPATATPAPTAVPTPMVSLGSFVVTPSEAVFGTVDKVEFSWEVDRPGNVKDYQLIENLSKESLPLDVAAPSIARFSISAATLVSTYGWGAHDYTLTITGLDDVERSSTASLNISPVICTLLPAVQIFSQPGPPNGPPIPNPPSKEIVIGGRSPDGKVVQVWDFGDHAPLGWTRSDGVTCPLTTPLDSYIIVTPWPPVTNTPAG